MLEAINSAVSNASAVRATADQLSSARSFAANPERVQEVPQAPYVSPYIHVDSDSNEVVLQIRNGETGKVIDQIPSGASLDEQRAQSQQAAAQAAAQQSAPQQQAPSSNSFGAFAKQVASLQTAVAGAGTGGTVSVLA